MIFSQKKLLHVLMFNLLIYGIFYLLMLNFNIITTENIVLVKYFSISTLLCSLILVFYITLKTITNWKFKIYQFTGAFLILFFIFSIFVFKAGDEVFLEHEVSKAINYFQFERLVMGLNYLFAIPYLLFLMVETAFLRTGLKVHVIDK